MIMSPWRMVVKALVADRRCRLRPCAWCPLTASRLGAPAEARRERAAPGAAVSRREALRANRICRACVQADGRTIEEELKRTDAADAGEHGTVSIATVR